MNIYVQFSNDFQAPLKVIVIIAIDLLFVAVLDRTKTFLSFTKLQMYICFIFNTSVQKYSYKETNYVIF